MASVKTAALWNPWSQRVGYEFWLFSQSYIIYLSSPEESILLGHEDFFSLKKQQNYLPNYGQYCFMKSASQHCIDQNNFNLNCVFIRPI